MWYNSTTTHKIVQIIVLILYNVNAMNSYIAIELPPAFWATRERVMFKIISIIGLWMIYLSYMAEHPDITP